MVVSGPVGGQRVTAQCWEPIAIMHRYHVLRAMRALRNGAIPARNWPDLGKEEKTLDASSRVHVVDRSARNHRPRDAAAAGRKLPKGATGNGQDSSAKRYHPKNGKLEQAR